MRISPWLALMMMLCASPGFGQDVDTAKLNARKTVYDVLFLSQTYQNRFTFFGRDYGQQVAFSSSRLLYYFHSNLWISPVAFYFFDSDIPLQLGISAGFYHEFSERTDLSLSATEFFVPQSSTVGANSQGAFMAMFGTDWKILYSTLQGWALISDHPDVFFTTQHSRYFQFNNLLWKRIKVSFEPKVSFSFGTNRFEQGDELIIGPGGGAIHPSGNPGSSSATRLKALNWDARFPLKFSIKTFSVEGTVLYTHPLKVVDGDPSKPGSVWLVDVDWYFPVKRSVANRK